MKIHKQQKHARKCEHPGKLDVSRLRRDIVGTHVQDFWGSTVTVCTRTFHLVCAAEADLCVWFAQPKLNIGEAYFRQKQPTHFFCIVDAAGNGEQGDRTVGYGYNSLVAHKVLTPHPCCCAQTCLMLLPLIVARAPQGPNNVISAVYHFLRTRGYLPRRQIAHFDRCAGQSNSASTQPLDSRILHSRVTLLLLPQT